MLAMAGDAGMVVMSWVAQGRNLRADPAKNGCDKKIKQVRHPGTKKSEKGAGQAI